MNRLGHQPKKPSSEILVNSHTILVGSFEAASSFLNLFEETRRSRKAKGTPTDREQDLLRAMLVFASAGLDSMLKQLIRDALAAVIERHEGARARFKLFVEKRLSRQGSLDPKFLSDVLTGTNPREVMLRELVKDLTSSSLQSKEQILVAASYFDIPSSDLTSDLRKLEQIFLARNQISHEMDVDLSQKNRNRRPRRRDEMIEHTKFILQLSTSLLVEVDKRLKQNS